MKRGSRSAARTPEEEFAAARARLKGGIISRFEHRRTKRTAEIRLDKRSMTFWTMIESASGVPEIFENRDGNEVEAWLSKKLEHTTDEFVLEWVPVILVEYDSQLHYRRRREKSEELKLEVERFWLALTPNREDWRKLEWEFGDEESPTELPQNERYAQSQHYKDGPAKKLELNYRGVKSVPFRIPYFEGTGYDGATSHLPYTPEIWAALEELMQTIRDARAGITNLVGTKVGLDTLSKIGAGKVPLKLTAGKKK